MTQLPLDFDSERTRKVDVWLWCAYLMRVEADAAMGQHAWPPVEPDHDTADACHEAADGFAAKAAKVAGEPITDERWSAALERF